MSLSSGVLFGSLLAYGAYRVSNNPRDFMFLLGIRSCVNLLLNYVPQYKAHVIIELTLTYLD